MVAKIIRGMCVSVAGTAFASLLQYALMSGEITWWVPLTGAGGAIALLILLESYRRESGTEQVSSLTPAQRVEVEKIRREFWGENVVPAPGHLPYVPRPSLHHPADHSCGYRAIRLTLPGWRKAGCLRTKTHTARYRLRIRPLPFQGRLSSIGEESNHANFYPGRRSRRFACLPHPRTTPETGRAHIQERCVHHLIAAGPCCRHTRRTC